MFLLPDVYFSTKYTHQYSHIRTYLHIFIHYDAYKVDYIGQKVQLHTQKNTLTHIASRCYRDNGIVYSTITYLTA